MERDCYLTWICEFLVWMFSVIYFGGDNLLLNEDFQIFQGDVGLTSQPEKLLEIPNSNSHVAPGG